MADLTASPTHETGFAHWKAVAFDTFGIFFDRDTAPRFAATAFFGFLAFFPAFAMVALIYGIVANGPLVADTLDAVRYLIPSMAFDILEEQLTMLANQPQATLGIGLLITIPLALWSGSRGVEALLYAMSRVRGEPERRNFFIEILVAVALTVGGAVFLSIALITVAGLPALIPFPSGEDWLVLIFRWPILLVLTIGVLMVLYRWGPDRHPRKFRFIWPGAVAASLLWIVAGAIFSIYVENWGNYNATFGSVSAPVVLMLWMYNSAQIFVLGAAFNAALERHSTSDT